MPIKKHLIITTINYPTAAVEHYSKLKDLDVIIVPDKKTPVDWEYPNTTLLTRDKLIDLNLKSLNTFPENHYCRKMLGYIYAIKQNAEVIIDTDDDNIPKESYGFPSFQGKFDFLSENQDFINIYTLFTERKIWPRGFPLNEINNRKEINRVNKDVQIGIWQGLVDNEPDVDALYRLSIGDECIFDNTAPIVLGKNTICPINSQNTITRKELFPLLYLPSTVTFRFTDILRGYVAQPIMWLYEYYIGFTSSNVIQIRNPHNLFNDFMEEVPMHQFSDKICSWTSGSISASQSIGHNLFSAYHKLYAENVVKKEELKLLEGWLHDIA